MGKINLLDCTLRDGAYITNGNFSDKVIKGIIYNLSNANIEMVEVGWLKEKTYEPNSVYFSAPSDIEKFIPQNNKKATKFMVMADYDRYDFSKIEECSGKSIDTIRLVFPKEKFGEAVEYSKIIKDKGYCLCLQAANTQSYSEQELIELTKKVNEVSPYSLSIVDTFGVMYNEDLKRIFKILDKNLDKNILLGFHSHNNLQLSFALSVYFIDLALNSDRNVIIDASLCGMGRGAGNTCNELITNYINIKHNGIYDTDAIMDTIDIYMTNIISKYKWGYDIAFCIAGQLASHVNNIAYLQNTHKITFKGMKKVLEQIPRENRKLYDYDVLEEAYVNYMGKEIDDSSVINLLKEELKDREILLIAPGKSILTHKNKILEFISKKTPVIIAVNSVIPDYDADYFFFSSQQRYKYAKEQYLEKFTYTKKIITSNISAKQETNECVVNYNKLIKRGWKYFENSMIMLMRLLAVLNVKSINLAGFDGFKNDYEIYSDDVLQANMTEKQKGELNEDIKNMLKNFISENKNNIDIKFITPSSYI